MSRSEKGRHSDLRWSFNENVTHYYSSVEDSSLVLLGCDTVIVFREDTKVSEGHADSIFRVIWEIKHVHCPHMHWLYPEDGGGMDIWNVNISPQHYTVSQPRGTRLKSSLPWKPQISLQHWRVKSTQRFGDTCWCVVCALLYLSCLIWILSCFK